MKRYKEVLEAVKTSVDNGTFSFSEYKDLDYTGVGFGYNLQKSYPKTMKKAKKEVRTPYFDAILRKVK